MKKSNYYLPIIPIIFLVACTQPSNYVDPLIKFQQASNIVIENSRVSYMTIDKDERNAVIDDKVFNKEEITLLEITNKEINILKPEELATRMELLDALSKHSQLLLSLANSDAPTKTAVAANSLQNSIVTLSETLGYDSNDKLKSTAQGFTAIASEVAKLVLEKKIQKAMDEAIINSDKNVKDTIRLLREEIIGFHERRKEHLINPRIMAVDMYNATLKRPSSNVEELQKAAEKIKKTEDFIDEFALIDIEIDANFDAMENAQENIVDYAKSPKTPKDLATLSQAIDIFVVKAQTIANSIKIIKEARKG